MKYDRNNCDGKASLKGQNSIDFKLNLLQTAISWLHLKPSLHKIDKYLLYNNNTTFLNQ